MNGELRHVIAGEAARGFAVNGLPEAVIEAIFPRGHRDFCQSIFKAERAQFARCVRQDVDPDANGLQFGSRLKDSAGNSGAMKHQPEGQPSDARADDQDFHGKTYGDVLAGPLAARQRSLGAPGSDYCKKQRHQNVIAGERDAEKSPGCLVAAHDPDILKTFQHVAG